MSAAAPGSADYERLVTLAEGRHGRGGRIGHYGFALDPATGAVTMATKMPVANAAAAALAVSAMRPDAGVVVAAIETNRSRVLSVTTHLGGRRTTSNPMRIDPLDIAVRITDMTALGAIRPDAIERHLLDRGYRARDPDGSERDGERWYHDDFDHAVLAPTDPAEPDYPSRVGKAIGAIAAAHRVSELRVYCALVAF